MGISRTYTIACAILCACTSGNQSAHTYTNDTDRTLVDNSNFEIEYDVIRMNTVINGTDTINAIFDTGALVHYHMDAVNFEKLFPNHQKITNINGITISEGDSFFISLRLIIFTTQSSPNSPFIEIPKNNEHTPPEYRTIAFQYL